MAEDLVSNRKAFHNYEILETYEAGIALLGTEIKSLRAGGGSLQDAYIVCHHGEMWMKNSSIAPYKFASVFNHADRRERKLLLHKREILKVRAETEEKGLAIIPIAIYLKGGIAKVKIAIARGKKAHDKRASIKAREHKRAMDRALKDH